MSETENNEGQQLRGEAFMDELDRRIQALTPEDMLDTSEEMLGHKKTSSKPIGCTKKSCGIKRAS